MLNWSGKANLYGYQKCTVYKEPRILRQNTFTEMLHLVSAIVWMRVMDIKQKYEKKALGGRNVLLKKDDEDILDRESDK